MVLENKLGITDSAELMRQEVSRLGFQPNNKAYILFSILLVLFFFFICEAKKKKSMKRKRKHATLHFSTEKCLIFSLS